MGAILIAFFEGAPAHATSGLDATPKGEFIYSREVPARLAYMPGEPGRADAVATSPDIDLLGAVGLSARRLTDLETGQIVARSLDAGLGSLAERVSGPVGANAGAEGTALLGMSGNGTPLSSGALGAGTSAWQSGLQVGLQSLGAALKGGNR